MSWEERMAAKAAARRAAEPPPPDPHAGHHVHYRGNTTWCSCGKFLGVFSVVVDLDAPVPPDRPCPECGEMVNGWFDTNGDREAWPHTGPGDATPSP
jgi:hypothetical protein